MTRMKKKQYLDEHRARNINRNQPCKYFQTIVQTYSSIIYSIANRKAKLDRGSLSELSSRWSLYDAGMALILLLLLRLWWLYQHGGLTTETMRVESASWKICARKVYMKKKALRTINSPGGVQVSKGASLLRYKSGKIPPFQDTSLLQLGS